MFYNVMRANRQIFFNVLSFLRFKQGYFKEIISPLSYPKHEILKNLGI